MKTRLTAEGDLEAITKIVNFAMKLGVHCMTRQVDEKKQPPAPKTPVEPPAAEKLGEKRGNFVPHRPGYARRPAPQQFAPVKKFRHPTKRPLDWFVFFYFMKNDVVQATRDEVRSFCTEAGFQSNSVDSILSVMRRDGRITMDESYVIMPEYAAFERFKKELQEFMSKRGIVSMHGVDLARFSIRKST